MASIIPVRPMADAPRIGAVKHSAIRVNVTTDQTQPEPRSECPSIRQILKENAQLRMDNAILINHLKTYEALYGRLT